MHFFLIDNAGYWIRDKDSPEQTPEDEAALGMDEEEDSAPVEPVAMAATAAEFSEKEEEDVSEVKDDDEEKEVSLAQSIFSKLNVPPHICH